MSLTEINSSAYRVGENDITVHWASFDFSKDVAGISDVAIRAALSETGVMYVPAATPAIRVSNLLPVALQGLSALHEELCMNQKLATCPSVEELVIDSIQDPELQADFIATRLRMFGALCILNSTDKQFAATRQLLTQRGLDES